MIASSAGHEEIVALLLEKNANAQILNFTGQSALHYAASKNQLSVGINNPCTLMQIYNCKGRDQGVTRDIYPHIPLIFII